MKGFELNDEELQDMFAELHSDLQKFIGEFHGKIERDEHRLFIFLDDSKYSCMEAVTRKIDNFFKDSQFDKDEFNIFVEGPAMISINYNYDL